MAFFTELEQQQQKKLVWKHKRPQIAKSNCKKKKKKNMEALQKN